MRKQIYRKENPIDKHKTDCSICGFLLDVNQGGSIDFVVRFEHLFLRNIYSYGKLKKMKIESQKKVSKVVHRVLEYYPLFEEAMQDCDEYDKTSEQIQDFLIEYVDDTFDDLKELKENIKNIEVSKKKKDLVTMKLEKFKKKHLVKKETFSPKN